MGKRLFLLLIAALMGIICSPIFLTPADTFVAEPIPLGAAETLESVSKASTKEIATSYAGNYQRVRSYTNVDSVSGGYGSVAYAPNNSINITGRTLEIVEVGSTTVDSGNHVNKYGDKFLYGHNTGAVFGGLTSMGVGSTFTVNYGGVTTNYRVAKVMIYEKNTSNGRLELNGSGNYMRGVANAVSDGVHYDLSVMTCYGTSYGNGDASHRLVLFAYAI